MSAESGALHVGILPIASSKSYPAHAPEARHRRPGHRRAAARPGSRAAPQHRRPRHGASEVAIDGGDVDVASRAHRRGLPAARPRSTSRVTDADRGARRRRRDVSLDFTVMTDDERAALRQQLHGDPAATAGSQPAHGHAEGRAIPFADPAARTRVLLIASGKGGVGKSSVTANLAVALAQRGKRVAVVDADVWGFSIPRMLGVDRPPVVIDQMLVPPEVHGVRCISMGFFADEDQPVIWRGPDAAQGARAVPHRRLLGRPRLPARRPAARHRRHLASRSRSSCRGPRSTSSPRRSRPRRRWRSAPRSWPRRCTSRSRASSRTCRGSPATTASATSCSAPAAAQELAEQLEVPLLGQVPLVHGAARGRRHGHPIVVASTPTARRPRCSPRIAEPHRRRAGADPPSTIPS